MFIGKDNTSFAINFKLLNLQINPNLNQQTEIIRFILHQIETNFQKYKDIKQIWFINSQYYLPGNTMAALISRQKFTRNFKRIDLPIPNISFSFWKQMMANFDRNCRFVTRLNLSNNQLGDKGIAYIQAIGWRFITEFWFAKNFITSKGVQSLTQCRWKYMKNLFLSHNSIQNKGLEELVKNDWKYLTFLRLDRIGITEDAAKLLSKTNWSSLTDISLEFNDIGNSGLKILVRSHWPKLKSMELDAACTRDQINNTKYFNSNECALLNSNKSIRIINRNIAQKRLSNEKADKNLNLYFPDCIFYNFDAVQQDDE